MWSAWNAKERGYYMAQENTTQTTSETFTSRKTPFEWAVFVISVAYACFFLYTAFSGPFTSIVQRGFHVCAGLIIWCLLDLNNKKKPIRLKKESISS